MHPGVYLIVGIIIGAILLYYLITKGIVPITLPK